MRNKSRFYIIKILIFNSIFIILATVIQNILLPKWYYPDTTLPEPVSRTFSGFYEEAENSLEVLITGTSHALYGVSPMEMYEKYSILSYNLASSVQPIQVTYYILKEAIKSQKLKVFVYDVSSLFINEVDESRWRYVLDSMPFSINKVNFAYEFKKYNPSFTFISGISPFYRYHERWKLLRKRDFTDFFRNKTFYSKGQYIDGAQIASGVTVDRMNLEMQDMYSSTIRELYEYKDEDYREIMEESYLYKAVVSEENIEWLLKIKRLCEENNIELLLVKVPVVYLPANYRSAWTIERCKEIKRICTEYGINYFDMLYDDDIAIDWETDTVDGGMHLNALGAQKLSDCLGNYILNHYRVNCVRNEVWEKDLETYKKMRKLFSIVTETDFIQYLSRIKHEYKDTIIFIAASADMADGLSEADIDGLRALGIRSDFSNASKYSFLAVIENGEVIYEVLSNRAVSYEGYIPISKSRYYIRSSGYYTNASATISINAKNYSINQRGLNIVLYDSASGLVLDSVCFDTCADTHTVYRNASREYMRAYETYLIEVEDR